MQPEDINILIGCEESGVIRDAFRRRGFNAWSCDLEPDSSGSEFSRFHFHGNVMSAIKEPPAGGWHAAILHPPCTYLSSSGLHWNHRVPGREDKTKAALEFVRQLAASDIPHIAIENPVGCISTRLNLTNYGFESQKASQYIQPYDFGDDASKRTGLWLKNLPPLEPTKYIQPRWIDGKPRWANQTDSGQNRLGPSEGRAAERSRTYPGIADAMADQWGFYLIFEMESAA